MHIETKRLVLRLAAPEDAAAVAGLKRDPLVREMALGHDYEVVEDDERAELARAADDESQIYLLLVLREDDRPVGYLRVNWMEHPRFAWLRFALGSDRGKGFMREALQGFLGRLFEEGLHRVDAEAYATNERSIRLMEGMGFRCEGIKREAHYDGETYVDMCAFGLLRPDFEAASR